MQRNHQKLDKVYEDLFTSFQNLESALNAKNRKNAHAASIASVNLLDTYFKETCSLGYNSKKLSSPQNTLSDLSSTLGLPQFRDILIKPAINALSKDIVEPIWHFHAANTDLSIAKRSSRSCTLLEMMEIFRCLPEDIILHIMTSLTYHDLTNIMQSLANLTNRNQPFKMSQFCVIYHHPLSLFKSSIDIERAFKEITKAGNVQLVKKWTDDNPELLTKRFNNTDYKGQEYKNMTLLQIALRAYNAGMKNMLKGQVEKYHGKEKMENQISDEASKWDLDQRAFDFSFIVAAITNSNDTDIRSRLKKIENETNICKAFKAFRENFSKCIIEAPNFTPVHLLLALDVYISKEPTWSNNQRMLYLRQVFSHAQRYCPAIALQDFAQGAYYLVPQNKEGLISFRWAHYDENIIDLNSSIDCPEFTYQMHVWDIIALAAVRDARLYKNYFKQCLQNLQPNLYSATDQHQISGGAAPDIQRF
jgi:hypothetical protein